MNSLEEWKTVPELSVDEFMCLLFGIEPGTVQFDYGDSKKWPKGADPIYRRLKATIKSGKLHVFFENPALDPEVNEQLGASLYSTGAPWWADGKIYKSQLVKWLIEENIPSKFFLEGQTAARTPDYLDNSNEHYSHKLAAAVRVWEYFNTHSLIFPKKSLKVNIEAWLTEHANELNLLHNKQVSKTAIQEIAKIVNWKPEGGAPKS